MTTTVGRSGTVYVGTNQVAEVRAFSINESAGRIEDTALGDSNRTYKAGLAEVSGTIECWWDKSDTNGQEAMTVGTTVSLDLRPEGDGSGLASYQVSAQITGIVLDGVSSEGDGQIITRTFEWAAAGALTKTTQ